jgi:hypothetical protein
MRYFIALSVAHLNRFLHVQELIHRVRDVRDPLRQWVTATFSGLDGIALLDEGEEMMDSSDDEDEGEGEYDAAGNSNNSEDAQRGANSDDALVAANTVSNAKP